MKVRNYTKTLKAVKENSKINSIRFYVTEIKIFYIKAYLLSN